MTAEWWTGPIGLGCVTEVKTVCAFHGILTDSSINGSTEMQKLILCNNQCFFFWIGKKSIIKEGLHYVQKKKKQPKVTKKEKENNNYIQEGSESTNNYIQEWLLWNITLQTRNKKVIDLHLMLG